MKKLLISLGIIFATSTLTAQSLPNLANIRVKEAIVFYKDSSTTNVATIEGDALVSYEKSKLRYLVDFANSKFEIRRRGHLIETANIVSIHQDSSRISVKLDINAAELNIDVQRKVFVYGYAINGLRVVKVSDVFDIATQPE